MKRVIFVLLFLGLAGISFADVTAKIIAVDKDEQGQIRVKTQYKIDSVEVPSSYPQQNGMYYWVTRYNVASFANMTRPQILARVKKDIRDFSKHLITQKFMAINNDAFVTAGQDIVNATNTENNATMDLDTDGNGIADTRWTLYTNGTKTETAIP